MEEKVFFGKKIRFFEKIKQDFLKKPIGYFEIKKETYARGMQ